jgi:hypothetical protein
MPTGGRERIAAERAPVVAGLEHVHHVCAREEGTHGQHAAAERLAERHAVRADPRVLEAEHLAGASEPGLDLVEEEQHVVLRADLADALEVAVGREAGCPPRPGSARRGTPPCSA